MTGGAVWIVPEEMRAVAGVLNGAGYATAQHEGGVQRLGGALAEWVTGRIPLHSPGLGVGLALPVLPAGPAADSPPPELLRRIAVLAAQADEVARSLRQIGEETSLLGRLLGSGALEYDLGEDLVAQLFRGGHEQAGLALGATAGSLLSPWAIPGHLWNRNYDGTGVELPVLLGALLGERGLTSPEAVLAIRMLVDAGDETLAGLHGLDPAWQGGPGRDGLTEGGVAATATLALDRTLGTLRRVARSLRVPFLSETPAAIARTASGPTLPPRSLGELAERIPASTDPHQIRIERYPDGRTIVFLGGTVDQSVFATGDAFDMTSNLSTMAEQRSASRAAAEQAMEQVGVGPRDPVLFVGYSQGGLVAATMAASERWASAGVVTFGSPIAHLDLGQVPVIEVAHVDDLVPALSGLPADHSDGDWIPVRREVFAGLDPPEGVSLPAHDLERYRETAAAADALGAAGVRRMLDPFSEVVGGSAMEWSARRSKP